MDKKRYIAEKYIEEAKQLHKENIVVDAHLDLAAEIFYRRLGGEKISSKIAFWTTGNMPD